MNFTSFFFSKKVQQKTVTSDTMSSSQGEKLQFPQEVEVKSQFDHCKQASKYNISKRKDDYRSPLAYQDGGMMCPDPKQVEKLRSVGKQMLKMIGRKILSGSFNLTKLSFPIRACVPKTALYNSIVTCATFPYFMERASKTTDPLQRFKLVTVAYISAPYYVNMFLKPLNPILGETLQGSLEDGTRIYAEQISHHPPISYFLVIGPNYSYHFSGYYNFNVSPSINSLQLENLGERKIVFKDGGSIKSTFPKSEFTGTFFGTTRCQQIGSCFIIDQKNDISTKIQFGKIKKKPTDYFQSSIVQKGKPTCKIYGTYCGFIEIEGERYWDGRDLQPFPVIMEKQIVLPSDWSFRIDLIQLQIGNIDEGQKLKEMLQEIQRKDAKLRSNFKKK